MQQIYVGGDNSISNSSMSNDSQRQPLAADSNCERQHQPSAAAATATAATTTTACRSASRLGKAPSALPPAAQGTRLDAPLDQDAVEGLLMRNNAPMTEIARDGRRTGGLQMYISWSEPMYPPINPTMRHPHLEGRR